MEQTSAPTKPTSVDGAAGGRCGARCTSPTAGSPCRCTWRCSSAAALPRGRGGPVGKTEVARALASALNARLIRLQCYEGLDVSQAVYEWNYSRQLLHLRLLEVSGRPRPQGGGAGAVQRGVPDQAAAAAGAGRAGTPRCCSSTSWTGPTRSSRATCWRCSRISDHGAGGRHVHGGVAAGGRHHVQPDAGGPRRLKRRCLYYWIDYPDLDKETQIVRSKAPGASQRLAGQVTAFVQELRSAELYKVPGRLGNAGLGRRRWSA